MQIKTDPQKIEELSTEPREGAVTCPLAESYILTARNALNPISPALPKLMIQSGITDESELVAEPPAIIDGLLRKQGKMLLTGKSKSGKSFLACQLGLCIATGTQWLSMPVTKGKVLYINLEIGDYQFGERQLAMAQKMGLPMGEVRQNFNTLQRPHCGFTMATLTQAMAADKSFESYDLIIIDPLYKVLEGDENSQKDVAAFFRQVDWLIDHLGCCVVIVHHQSKGRQDYKPTIDRMSGSGLFGRDPDALMTIGKLDAPGNAMRAEFQLRDFPPHEPMEYHFCYPVCQEDISGKLASCSYHVEARSHAKQQKAAKLSELEEICEELMKGRPEFNRTELVRKAEWNPKNASKLNGLFENSKRFKIETLGNKATVTRR